MARFGAPRGLQGEVSLQLHTRAPQHFLQQPQWWCCPPRSSDWRQVAVTSCRQIQDRWYAILDGVRRREDAEAWKHGTAGLLRSELPPANEDEYYWCDMLGLQVVNTQGQTLGVVKDFWATGANDIMSVQPPAAESDSAADSNSTASNKKSDSLLIPFVSDYVLSVDLQAGIIRVWWEADW